MKVNPPLRRNVVLKLYVSACRVKNGYRQNLLYSYLRGIFIHFLCLFNGYWTTATMMMELTKKKRQEKQLRTLRASQSVSLTSCHMTIASSLSFPPDRIALTFGDMQASSILTLGKFHDGQQKYTAYGALPGHLLHI